MQKALPLSLIVSLALPIVGILIVLWSDVQTLKATKADYRELAKLETNVMGQLSKNTEAIENLNRVLERYLNERSTHEQQKTSN